MRRRVRRIQQSLVATGHSPEEKRGKHGNHHLKTPEAVISLIEYHILSLRRRQSQYSIRKFPNHYYLHESLTSLRDVHKLFLSEYRINVSEYVY